MGEDSDSCNGSKEGAIRYDTTSKCAEYCNGTSWTCPDSGGYAGPTYRSYSTTKPSGGADPLTISKPTGTVQNDLMVAVLCRDNSGSPMSAPAGWTVQSERNVSTANRFGLFYKVAGASEPASYDFAINDTNESVVGTIVTLTGQSTTTPVDTYAEQTGSSESPAAPSITPSANTLILNIYCNGEAGAISAPGLHTVIESTSSGSGIGGAGLQISYRENTFTTASGAMIGSCPDDSWLGAQFSVQP